MATTTSDPKTRIILAAIDLYVNSPDQFTDKNIAKKAKVKEAELYQHFNSKNLILSAFYGECVAQYRQMILEIDDFQSFSLAEKMANFIYTMFDLLQEQREFVEMSFESMIFKKSGSAFHTAIEEILDDFLSSEGTLPLPQRPFINNSFFYSCLTNEYLHLVKFWLSDDSENTADTIALVDKLIEFFCTTVQSDIVEKGFDLVKFLWERRLLTARFW